MDGGVGDPLAAMPVTALKGVGDYMAGRLERLGLRTVQDLLLHLPLRYQDRTRVVPIATLRPGDQAVIEAEVQHTEVSLGRRPTLLCRVADSSGGLTLRFFHYTNAQKTALTPGTVLRCFGEVRSGLAGLEMVHPEYSRTGPEPAPVAEHLTPIYPTTEGLQQPYLRRLIGQALEHLARQPFTDWLPPPVLTRLALPSLGEALAYVHHPPPDAPLALMSEGHHPAQRRLAFEELLAHHLSLRRLREHNRRHTAPALHGDGALRQGLRRALPFQLTTAQERVVAEVAADLAAEAPMQRLVQGDVGSGKTVVAALAVLQAVEAGWQAAVMAPTELLAEQHLRNFDAWLTPLGVQVAGLSNRTKGRARRSTLEDLALGNAAVTVGTHALFQEEVVFRRLGLVVVDEQHRFGVHQRLALREKGRSGERYPHQLIMTATPIPRTLAQTAYADLDVSVIDELPPGRTPVETVALSDARREEVIERVRAACREGRQAYWVCTLIEESEALQAEAAEDTAALLREALPELRVALVHGRMKAVEKEQVMAEFKAAALDLLVATTVIEVGVDVPNASLMIIENAERLGLAQLHQLRGRVGRGSAKSSCVLMYHGPLSAAARERLGIMRQTNDGFLIAQKDLEIRGPGELLGTRQTGTLLFRIADLRRDQDLVDRVGETARHLLDDYPGHVTPLIRRWLGEGERYGNV